LPASGYRLITDWHGTTTDKGSDPRVIPVSPMHSDTLGAPLTETLGSVRETSSDREIEVKQ